MKNGDVLKDGTIYNRRTDFKRDAYYELISKAETISKDIKSSIKQIKLSIQEAKDKIIVLNIIVFNLEMKMRRKTDDPEVFNKIKNAVDEYKKRIMFLTEYIKNV